MSSQTGSGVTRQDIADGLRRLGLGAGDGVIVHSSLKSFGRAEGGPAAVIGALQEVLTAEGTLMMPAFNQNQAFGPDGPGYFDPQSSPSMVGAVTQVFWQMPGVLRSLHPTHSFAVWGRDAERYVAGHHRTLTCGPDSPIGRLWRDGGYGLLLGAWYNSNTIHHAAEQVHGSRCLAARSKVRAMRLPDGRMVEGRAWTYRASGCGITDSGKYGDLMAERGVERVEMIGACKARLFKLDDCFNLVTELLREGMGDWPACARCPVGPRPDADVVESDWDAERRCLKDDSAAWGY